MYKASDLYHRFALELNFTLTLNKGASTEEPAFPYSNAMTSCGNILCLENASGNVSKTGERSLKNLIFSPCSFI